MPTVAAGGGHILNMDILLLQICPGSDGTKGCARIDKHPPDDDDDEEGEQGEETIPKQGNAASVAEALADRQAELEAQSAIPSAGKERGKESAKQRCIECCNKTQIRRRSEIEGRECLLEEEVGRVGGET